MRNIAENQTFSAIFFYPETSNKASEMESQKINRIKVALVENGKTGKWLAAQVGKNEATVSRWCSNKMQPSLDTLVRISELLDIDVKDLIVSNIA